MRRRPLVSFAVGFQIVAASISYAQRTTDIHPGTAGSPHVRSEFVLDAASISVEYGRPHLNGRTPGKDVDPYNRRVWRMGADEATTLTTDKPLKFGSLAVPAGTYTLYAVSVEGVWQLIVSKRTGQWGIPYPDGEDLGRVPMTVRKLTEAVAQLTISVIDNDVGGILQVDWGSTRATVPIWVEAQ